MQMSPARLASNSEKCAAFLSRNIDGCLEADQLFQTNPPFTACFAYAVDSGRVFRIWVSVDAPAAERGQVTASLKESLAKKYGPPKTIIEPGMAYGSYSHAEWQYGTSNILNLNVSGGYATIEYISPALTIIADQERKARLSKAASGL